MTNFAGRCHCGNVSYELLTARSEREFTPRECSCTLCRMHRASWISDPDGELVLSYASRDSVTHYRFGHRTSDFVVCRECGGLVVALCELDGQLRAVINIRTMPENTFSSAPITTDFDAESIEERLGRRRRNWTGRVVVR